MKSKGHMESRLLPERFWIKTCLTGCALALLSTVGCNRDPDFGIGGSAQGQAQILSACDRIMPGCQPPPNSVGLLGWFTTMDDSWLRAAIGPRDLTHEGYLKKNQLLFMMMSWSNGYLEKSTQRQCEQVLRDRLVFEKWSIARMGELLSEQPSRQQFVGGALAQIQRRILDASPAPLGRNLVGPP